MSIFDRSAFVAALHNLTDGTCIQWTSARVCFLFEQHCSSHKLAICAAGAQATMIKIQMLMMQLVSTGKLTLFILVTVEFLTY